MVRLQLHKHSVKSVGDVETSAVKAEPAAGLKSSESAGSGSGGLQTTADVVPIGGGVPSYVFYFTTVQVGTPPQAMTVSLDTGSADMGLTVKDCTLVVNSTGSPQTCALSGNVGAGCSATQLYDPSASSTAVPCPTGYGTACDVDVCYADGQGWTSNRYTESFSIGALKPTTVTMGGVNHQYGAWTSNTTRAGTIGLAFKNCSRFGTDAPVTQLLAANNLTSSFSMCLGNSTSNDYEGGGYMLLGESPPVTQNFAGYTKLIPSEYGYYNVNLQSIQVAKAGSFETISIDSTVDYAQSKKGTIVDSGTTYLTLTQDESDALWDALISLNLFHINGQGKCTRLHEDPSEFTMSFTFPNADGSAEDVTMTIPLKQLLVDCTSVGYPGFAQLRESVSTSTVIGEVAMHNNLFEFDMENMRIGITTNQVCDAGYNLNTTTTTGATVATTVKPAVTTVAPATTPRTTVPTTITPRTTHSTTKITDQTTASSITTTGIMTTTAPAGTLSNLAYIGIGVACGVVVMLALAIGTWRLIVHRRRAAERAREELLNTGYAQL